MRDEALPLPTLGSDVPALTRAYGRGNLCCVRPGGGSLDTELLDLDGDGLLDLMVGRLCDDTEVGVTRWDVYKGTCRP